MSMVKIEQILKKTVAFFKSRKLTIALVVLLIIFSFLGTVIPQQSQLKPFVYESWKTGSEWSGILETFGLTNVYASPAFLVLIILLFLNTLFCTSGTLKVAFRKFGKILYRDKNSILKFENHSEIVTDRTIKQAAEDVISMLRKNRYLVRREGKRISAEKNRFAVFGTPMFHICILIVLLAVFYGRVERMEGAMELVEGQMLTESHRNYVFLNEGPLFNEKHQNFGVVLERFYPNYREADGPPRGMASKLVIIENGQKVDEGMVHTNRQIIYKGVTIYQSDYGFAPLLILKDRDGVEISGSYVIAKDDTGSGVYYSSFYTGEDGFEGEILLYPNTLTTEINSEYGYDIPQDPHINLKLYSSDEEIFVGTLGLGEVVDVGDMSIGFYDLKYWSTFYFVKDKGTYIVFAGFFLAIASLSVTFFMVPKRIFVEIEKDAQSGKTAVYVGGTADRFNSSFSDEYSGLIKRIRERISNGSN